MYIYIVDGLIVCVYTCNVCHPFDGGPTDGWDRIEPQVIHHPPQSLLAFSPVQMPLLEHADGLEARHAQVLAPVDLGVLFWHQFCPCSGVCVRGRAGSVPVEHHSLSTANRSIDPFLTHHHDVQAPRLPTAVVRRHAPVVGVHAEEGVVEAPGRFLWIFGFGYVS